MTPKQKKAKVKKINLQRGHVAHIVVPEGHTPLVVPDAERGVVKIAAVEKKSESWWDYLFGPEESKS